jgi:hypothetical protein
MSTGFNTRTWVTLLLLLMQCGLFTGAKAKPPIAAASLQDSVKPISSRLEQQPSDLFARMTVSGFAGPLQPHILMRSVTLDTVRALLSLNLPFYP